MGPITGLATIATALVVLVVVSAVVVLALTAAFVVPARRVTRTDRMAGRSASPATTCTPSPRTEPADSRRSRSRPPADVPSRTARRGTSFTELPADPQRDVRRTFRVRGIT